MVHKIWTAYGFVYSNILEEKWAEAEKIKKKMREPKKGPDKTFDTCFRLY